MREQFELFHKENLNVKWERERDIIKNKSKGDKERHFLIFGVIIEVGIIDCQPYYVTFSLFYGLKLFFTKYYFSILLLYLLED